MVSKYPHLVLSQSMRVTDGQNYNSQDHPHICSCGKSNDQFQLLITNVRIATLASVCQLAVTMSTVGRCTLVTQAYNKAAACVLAYHCTHVKGRRPRTAFSTSCVNGAFEACMFAMQCYRPMHSRQALHITCMHI